MLARREGSSCTDSIHHCVQETLVHPGEEMVVDSPSQLPGFCLIVPSSWICRYQCPEDIWPKVSQPRMSCPLRLPLFQAMLSTAL